MRLNERERGILRGINHGPRTAHSFTHGPAPCAPHVIQAYLDHLVGADLIELRRDTYTITEAGREYLAAEPEKVPARYYGNASMPPGSYVPPTVFVRAGANDHLEHRSRGIGA